MSTVRVALKSLLDSDASLLQSSSRLRDRLKDGSPFLSPSQLKGIVLAVDLGLIASFPRAHDANRLSNEALIARLQMIVLKLHTDGGLREDVARFAAEAWAFAFGYTPPRLPPLAVGAAGVQPPQVQSPQVAAASPSAVAATPQAVPARQPPIATQPGMGGATPGARPHVGPTAPSPVAPAVPYLQAPPNYQPSPTIPAAPYQQVPQNFQPSPTIPAAAYQSPHYNATSPAISPSPSPYYQPQGIAAHAHGQLGQGPVAGAPVWAYGRLTTNPLYLVGLCHKKAIMWFAQSLVGVPALVYAAGYTAAAFDLDHEELTVTMLITAFVSTFISSVMINLWVFRLDRSLGKFPLFLVLSVIGLFLACLAGYALASGRQPQDVGFLAIINCVVYIASILRGSSHLKQHGLRVGFLGLSNKNLESIR